MLTQRKLVIPAKAGIHGFGKQDAFKYVASMDPGLRRDDDMGVGMARFEDSPLSPASGKGGYEDISVVSRYC
jgi:hypothetical protein